MIKIKHHKLRKYFIGSALIFITVLTSSAFAEVLWPNEKLEAHSEGAKNDLLQMLNNITSFESNYEQTVFDNKNTKLEVSRGKFYLDSKGSVVSSQNKNLEKTSSQLEHKSSFKNVIDHPEKSAMISDGSKLWMIDYELEQVIVSYLQDYLENSPLSLLLGGSKKGLDNFSVKKSENNGLNQTLYKLKSLDPLASIAELRLGFKESMINYIELDERSGNKVRINFSNISALNNAEEVFKVTIPKGFDLVDETKLLSNS